jgi:hypothetical protein
LRKEMKWVTIDSSFIETYVFLFFIMLITISEFLKMSIIFSLNLKWTICDNQTTSIKLIFRRICKCWHHY